MRLFDGLLSCGTDRRSVPQEASATVGPMFNPELISKIIQIKLEKGYTLYDLSKKLDIQISTIERWIRTKRINKVYARIVTERLKIE